MELSTRASFEMLFLMLLWHLVALEHLSKAVRGKIIEGCQPLILAGLLHRLYLWHHREACGRHAVVHLDFLLSEHLHGGNLRRVLLHQRAS